MSRDLWTDDYFQPQGELASLFGNGVGHLPEAAIVPPWASERLDGAKLDGIEASGEQIGPPWQDWDEFARSVAAKHADRDPVCECGACRAAALPVRKDFDSFV